jgi:CRISPR system Cascade subunit CasD
MPNTLFLRFEAPLQSWGERAQWSERDTAPEPTKSGIVGLLACALGWADDERIVALSRAIRVGVRCDHIAQPTTLTDFHTVGGGYTEPQLLTGAGKPKRSNGRPHTEPTKRYYLMDACFLVAAQSTTAHIDKLAEAVQSPVWPVFLGRKSCVPTRPVYDGVGDHATLEDALRDHPARMTHALRNEPSIFSARAILECGSTEEGCQHRRDAILKPTVRLFGARYSREILIDNVPVQYILGEPTSTTADLVA